MSETTIPFAESLERSVADFEAQFGRKPLLIAVPANLLPLGITEVSGVPVEKHYDQESSAILYFSTQGELAAYEHEKAQALK